MFIVMKFIWKFHKLEGITNNIYERNENFMEKMEKMEMLGVKLLRRCSSWQVKLLWAL